MTTLLGRDRAFIALRDAVARAQAGAALSLVVDGNRGLGKTALLEQFRAEHIGLPALCARAHHWERNTPHAVVEQLTKADVAEPGWQTVLDRVSDAAITGGPVLVLVDDAHNIDRESMRALTGALDRAVEGMLVVLAVDPDTAEPGDAETLALLDDCRRERIWLRPLTPAHVAVLAVEVAGVRLGAVSTARLAAHTGGNPAHLVRLLRESDPQIWSRWTPLLPVPRAEYAAAAAALGSATDSGRRLLEAAAVLSTSSGLGEAAALAAVTDPVAALDAARATGLIRLDQTRPLSVVAFPDPVVRAAVLNCLPALRLRELHRRAAASADDEGVRLAHLVAAEPTANPALATRLDIYAATRANNGEWGACADALIAASHISSTPRERENRLIRGVDALIGAGSIPRAEALVPEIESFGDGALRDSVLGHLAVMRGRAAEAQLLLTRGWRELGDDPAGPVAASIGQRHVLDALARWDGQRLLHWAGQVARITTGSMPEAIEAAAINGLGHAMTGDIATALRTYDTDLVESVSGAQSQRFRMAKGWLALAMDDYDDARLLLANAVPTAFRFGSTRISLWAQAWLARAQFAVGEWDEALRTVEHAALDAEESGIDLIRPLIHWTGAQICSLRGEDDSAHVHLRLGRADSPEYMAMRIPAGLAQAQYAESRADYQGVVRALGGVARIAPDSDLAGLWPWADLYATGLVLTGRVGEADTFLAGYEHSAAVIDHRSSLARFGAVRGRIIAATDGIDAARPAFESALQAVEDLPLPFERARIEFAYGQVLRRAGKRRDADTVMRSARELFATLGAQVLVQRCDRELKAAGVNTTRSRDPFFELTEQERAVATLVSAGRTNRQAAEELFLSVKTIQYHLTRVYAKLGTRSRTELAAYLHESDR
ncbi:LuxR C-terminal-related transcriptional regulator [Nocardia sp. NPDC056541]|uniref:helix-turn-helix transcriptional regulator n=1 Tax=Nocardia sp. NPDC056541 TaxID=3345860 RepID=UPI00366C2E8F